ncbi:hypothetical protein [Pasteuria penetrans]|uniref:hypothetical protein n=1 Tax=Pasteuria penetrans TaxID=86005 RepID=UPI00165B5875|nr:hypothetical protein [Pasteuria penetrans]
MVSFYVTYLVDTGRVDVVAMVILVVDLLLDRGGNSRVGIPIIRGIRGVVVVHDPRMIVVDLGVQSVDVVYDFLFIYAAVGNPVVSFTVHCSIIGDIPVVHQFLSFHTTRSPGWILDRS